MAKQFFRMSDRTQIVRPEIDVAHEENVDTTKHIGHHVPMANKKISGAMSKCMCGHTGDKRLGDKKATQHAGIVGHGACTVKGCPCFKFTWAEFLPGVVEARRAEMAQANR